MQISVAEAQGQLLELVRRAEAGEEVVLTFEGRVVAKIDAVEVETKAWAQMTPDQRLLSMQKAVEKIAPLTDGGPDAARSQDYLYNESGLPA